MALNNAIVRNKTIIQEILSADPHFILNKVREKELITGREYTKLNSNKGDAEDLVIKLVDILINKGRESKFIGLLQDEIVLETYPKLEDVEWEDSGSTASSSSLSIGKSFRQALTEKELLKVAETLGQEWEQAAIHLGLKTKDLDTIKAEHRPVAMQKQKMLVLWKRRRPPGEATAQDLLRGLKDMEDLPVETRLLLTGNVHINVKIKYICMQGNNKQEE
uniref:Death domain-containing protein n=1 Tax=Gadus morhua TaxID=8049 RepID=A0A8C5FI28_GADMO